jgi:hypothetical protein
MDTEQHERKKDRYRKWYRENREERLAYSKKWREEHPERTESYKKRQKLYDDTRNAKPEAKARRKARNLKYNYGLLPEDYNRMFKEQGGACAICGRPEIVIDPRTGLVRSLSVDHDHKTGRARQLLCCKCNHGIGAFEEDIDVMLKAIEYLKKHKE